MRPKTKPTTELAPLSPYSSFDKYGFLHFPAHLKKSGQDSSLRRLLLDFGWLNSKLNAFDINKLISDYDIALSRMDKGSALLTIVEALRLSSHVLLDDKSQLAGQIIGRLRLLTQDDIQALLGQAKSWHLTPWLHPLTASLRRSNGLEISTLEGQNKIMSLAVSSSGRRAVTRSDEGVISIWDLSVGKVEGYLIDNNVTLMDLLTPNYLTTIKVIAISQDGKCAASPSTDSTIIIWDLDEGKEKFRLEGDGNLATSLVMMPVGNKKLISGHNDGTIKIWDLDKKLLVGVLNGHSEEVTCMAISSDGHRLISGSRDDNIKVWSLDLNREEFALAGHKGAISSLAISKDGFMVMSGSYDRTIRMWDLEARKEVGNIYYRWGPAWDLDITTDAKRAVSIHGDWTFCVWNLVSLDQEQNILGHIDTVRAVRLLPDGRVITGSIDKTLKVWDIDSKRQDDKDVDHEREVESIAITLDGSRAVSISVDTLVVWNIKTISKLKRISWEKKELLPIYVVAITPDNKTAIIGSFGSITIYDLVRYKTKFRLSGHKDQVNALTITTDGHYAVSGSRDGNLIVWDLEKHRKRHTLTGHRAWVHSVATTANKSIIASGSYDHLLKIWDVENGECLYTLNHDCIYYVMTVTPDGRKVIAGCEDGTLWIWNLETGHRESVFKSTIGLVSCLAVSPDGKSVVSGSQYNELKVWSLETEKEIFSLDGHVDMITTLAISPDNRLVVSGSDDKTVRVWDMRTGKIISSYHANGRVNHCKITPDKLIMAGDNSGRVHILRLEGFD